MRPEIAELTRRIELLEQELARLRDLREIEDVITRYSRALDWLDAAALDRVIFDDAEIDYGFFRGSGRDFKRILMDVARNLPRRWHFTSQVKILLNGDSADVESYNFSLATSSLTAGSQSEVTHFHGYYQDRVARRAGRWGIIRRTHVIVSAVALPELPMAGRFENLNPIGWASTEHPNYRPLGD